MFLFDVYEILLDTSNKVRVGMDSRNRSQIIKDKTRKLKWKKRTFELFFLKNGMCDVFFGKRPNLMDGSYN